MPEQSISKTALESARKASLWQWKCRLYREFIASKGLESDFRAWFAAKKYQFPRE